MVTGEIEIPPKRLLIVPKRNSTSITPDGHFLLNRHDHLGRDCAGFFIENLQKIRVSLGDRQDRARSLPVDANQMLGRLLRQCVMLPAY